MIYAGYLSAATVAGWSCRGHDPLRKGHGLGNDYLVVNEADLQAPLSEKAIVRICDRNWGVGSDGIFLLVPTQRADFGLRIFNPDGSEAEKSGNGLRIFAKYLWDHGRTKKATFTVDTKGGVVECLCRVENGRIGLRDGRDGPGDLPRARDSDERTGPRCGRRAAPARRWHHLSVTAVSVGNPHCVTFVDRLDEGECRRLGPLIERHPAFPNRTNVQFARVSARDAVDILIWERGAGYTLASGSSSCGAASAAVRNGLCAHGRVKVNMPGGQLTIEVRPDWSLRLDGPVEEVYQGTLSAEFAETPRS